MAKSADEAKSSEPTPRHIMIIDDRLDDVAALKMALENRGLQVTYISDPNLGLAIMESDPPDLLILDLMMPKRSGFLVLEDVVSRQRDPFPIIMTTAINGQRHRDYAKELGVSAYLQKPYSIERAVELALQLLADFQR